jgi:hypothetical protein
MKRCGYCFRYTAGEPARCPRCARTYDLRWCVNQHANAATDAVCQRCRSDELSTPAPIGGVLDRFAQWTVVGTLVASVVVVLAVALIGLVAILDWNQLMPRLLLVAAMPYVMYRSTLVLPGPIRRALPFEQPHETSHAHRRRRSTLQL